MPAVLFVCTANRFRSPLASAFFQKERKNVPAAAEWTTDSAGAWTLPGLPVLPEVALIASRFDLDLTAHRSKPVTAALLEAHHLILVMTIAQQEALQNEFPAVARRIHLLSWAAERRCYDIPDATYSFDAMFQIAQTLHRLIRSGLPNICSLLDPAAS
jgi:protein-tyrosine-phosphatase